MSSLRASATIVALPAACRLPPAACRLPSMLETTAPIHFCFWNMSRPGEYTPVLRRLRYRSERAHQRHLPLRDEP
jgi:hypothetical protein